MKLALALTLAVTGCGQAVAADAWEPTEFPVGFWCGPPVQYNTLESWQRVADCGFTMGGFVGGYSVADNQKMLDFCRQLGTKTLVYDQRVSARMAGTPTWQDSLAGIVNDYSASPALYGYFIQDEPGHGLFPFLADTVAELRRLDPGHLPYINLFPTYATAQQLGTPTYADHLERFLTMVQPGSLSYDHYCLNANGDGKQYFENLGLIRAAAQRHGVPPWNIIQAMSYDPAVRRPNPDEMRWQVYTSLAYGMKGLMYFVYWSYTDDPRFMGIVDNLGQPGPLFESVSQLNHEIGALGPTLMKLTSASVVHTGETPLGATRIGSDALVALPDDTPLVAGFFRDPEGVDYVLIANASHDLPADFDMTPRPHVVVVNQVSPVDATDIPVPLVEGKATVHLEPGDGKLFRLTTKFTYPEPPPVVRTIDYDFDKDGELGGWGGFVGMVEPVVKGGVLTLTFAGPDPSLSRPWVNIDPDTYSAISVRMKLPPCNPAAQFFWTTEASPQAGDDKYMDFPIQPDGQWHEYTIPVATHPLWKGQRIWSIRLDPTVGDDVPGDKVEIDWIKGVR